MEHGPMRKKMKSNLLRNSTRKEHRDVDRISGVLALGRLWYSDPDAIIDAVGYAKFHGRSHNSVI
jgi:hypothetical protein